MGTRRIFRRGGGAQNVKYPPCLASPGIAWAALVKGSSAYSTKAELIPLSSGSLLGCPLAVYAGIAGSMAGAPGRWLYRGRKLGGALILSFSGRSSFPLPSLSSFPSSCLWCGALGGAGSAVWLVVAWAGAGCPLASCWLCPPGLALGAGAGCCPLLALRPFLSWVLALGSGAAVSLCPLSWVLAFLCCPLVLACYALGLGAGLGWGRCRGCPGRGGGGWLVAGVRRSGGGAVRHIAQILTCRFGYYSREKR